MSNPAAAQSCFCQSALLNVIKTNPTVNQCTVCGQADWTSIASYYNGQCNGGANAAVSVSSSAAAAAPQQSTTLIVVTSTAAGAADQGAAAATSSVVGASTTNNASPDSSNADNNVADYTNGQEW